MTLLKRDGTVARTIESEYIPNVKYVELEPPSSFLDVGDAIAYSQYTQARETTFRFSYWLNGMKGKEGVWIES